ncbi:MAG: hypothetical protein ACOVSW_04015 [Candidatus Kapaibacteriota bacterium]
MLHIPKDRVQNLLVLEHLARLHQLDEAIALYERRYNTTFAVFEERVNTALEEDMTAWDDYIEWLAYEQSRTETRATLEELRNGEFELA